MYPVGSRRHSSPIEDRWRGRFRCCERDLFVDTTKTLHFLFEAGKTLSQLLIGFFQSNDMVRSLIRTDEHYVTEKKKASGDPPRSSSETLLLFWFEMGSTSFNLA